jgi:hypothetical protein
MAEHEPLSNAWLINFPFCQDKLISECINFFDQKSLQIALKIYI